MPERTGPSFLDPIQPEHSAPESAEQLTQLKKLTNRFEWVWFHVVTEIGCMKGGHCNASNLPL